MFEAVSTAIVNRTREEWVDTDVVFDNEQYNQKRGTSFVRVQIDWVSSNYVGVSTRRTGSGYAMFEICTPAYKGALEALEIADGLSAIFNGWHVLGIAMGASYTQRVGEFNEWYKINLVIPFDYTECAT